MFINFCQILGYFLCKNSCPTSFSPTQQKVGVAHYGHQGLDATYPSIKHEIERSHLHGHGSLPHTPKTCHVYLRTIEKIDQHHVANVADDRVESSGGEVAARGKFHKSTISSPVFPIASLGNGVPLVLHIFLGIVLKLFKMLLDHVKSRDCISNESGGR